MLACCATRPGLDGDAVVVHMLQVGFSTSLGLLQRNGADIDKFMDILRGSALYAPTFDKKLQRMLDRDYANPNFPTKVTSATIDFSFLISEQMSSPQVSSRVAALMRSCFGSQGTNDNMCWCGLNQTIECCQQGMLFCLHCLLRTLIKKSSESTSLAALHILPSLIQCNLLVIVSKFQQSLNCQHLGHDRAKCSQRT